MRPLFLVEPVQSAMAALAPFVILPVAIIIVAISVPAVRYLLRRPSASNRFLLFLLGLPDLILGVPFMGIIRDTYIQASDEAKAHLWVVALLAFICSAVMTLAGAIAEWNVIYFVYKWTARALKDRMG